MLLCIDRRVSFKAIDRFDMNFKEDGARARAAQARSGPR
jgi:hypothetical protein